MKNFKTLMEVENDNYNRINDSNFDYYSDENHEICIIHMKFGDLKKMVLNLNFLKDKYFVEEFQKYFIDKKSDFKTPLEIVLYIQKHNLPVIIYDNFCDQEISINEAISHFKSSLTTIERIIKENYKNKKTHPGISFKTVNFKHLPFEQVYELIDRLAGHNYDEFIKAIFRLETGIDDYEKLSQTYDEYMQNDDISLLNPDLIDELHS